MHFHRSVSVESSGGGDCEEEDDFEEQDGDEDGRDADDDNDDVMIEDFPQCGLYYFACTLPPNRHDNRLRGDGRCPSLRT